MSLDARLPSQVPAESSTGPRKTIDELLAEARRRIERLAPFRALAAAKRGAIIVDTRTEGDRRREGLVPGAIYMPRTVLEWRCDPDCDYRDERLADLTKHLIIMCSDGYSSSLAAATLRDIGFERVGDMIGGFRAWAAAGLPVEAGS